MTDELRKALHNLHEAIRAEQLQNTKDILGSVKPLGGDVRKIKDDLAVANTKLDAIMSGEVLATKSQVLNVLHELRAKGIELDESKIFVA